MEEKERRRQENLERRREQRRKQVLRQKMILGGVLALILILLLVLAVKGLGGKGKEKDEEPKKKTEEKKEPETVTLTVSAAGDCTLGTDENFDYESGFVGRYEKEQNPAYFFEKVKPVFEKDDLTIVNMEGTFTESTARAENKLFAFKGAPEYAKILTEGSVEAANLANNHTFDYGEQSYTDTIKALDAVGITSFGYDRTAVMDVKGVKVGLLGTYELDRHMDCEEEMIENIEKLKEEGAQLIIATFHWGIELETVPNETQIALAHSAVDHGADLVLGHHPHVLQGIEEYKGKNIVYSLANFCFGGNSSPNDMDTMIFQQTFTMTDGKLKEDNVTNIIPCKISSAYEQGYNDYQPTPVEGETGEAIFSRLEEYGQAIRDIVGEPEKTPEKKEGEAVQEE